MHDSGFRRWRVLGALASASLLLPACKWLPRQGGDWELPPGSPRSAENAGYNLTIKHLPTSIDPRTPQTEGVSGRTLRDDPSGMMRRSEAGRGGTESGMASTGTSQPPSISMEPQAGQGAASAGGSGESASPVGSPLGGQRGATGGGGPPPMGSDTGSAPGAVPRGGSGGQ